MGIASLFMPALLGIVADRWINAEKVLGACHLAGALLLFWASTVGDANMMYWVMFFNAMVFMPTIALNNTVSYIILENKGFNIVKDFPPIRVWGTVGFICAMWLVDIFNWTQTPIQFLVSGAASVVMGVYCFTMPACKPAKATKSASWISTFGLDALVLFRKSKWPSFLFSPCYWGLRCKSQMHLASPSWMILALQKRLRIHLPSNIPTSLYRSPRYLKPCLS